MSSRYDDIINLPHHVSATRSPMPLANRAAQFAPFAALTGHEDAIRDTARLTGGRIELSADEQDRLTRRLRHALNIDGAKITVGYFCPDHAKDGGEYVTVSGWIKRVDEVDSCMILHDSSAGTRPVAVHRIPLGHVVSITGDIFSGDGWDL